MVHGSSTFSHSPGNGGEFGPKLVTRKVSRSYRRWVLRGLIIPIPVLVMTFVGTRVSDSSLNRDRQVRAETLYRQVMAGVDLDEKELMVQIIDQLDSRLTDDQRARVAGVIVEGGRRYNFDPLLLVAMIVTESTFGPREVSSMGARGLMQIKPSVAKAVANRRGLGWKHADQLFEPEYNVRLGTHYLFELVAQFKDVKKAIIAYNYGETAIRSRIRNGQQLPTSYFRRVKKNYFALRERFGAEVPWEPTQFELPIQ